MSISKEELSTRLKMGMRRLASGVSIVTAKGKDNKRIAMTVSSVTSVSDNPASLLVCVNKSANMASVLTLGDTFVVNVLNQSHQDISNACATPEIGESRFTLGHWVQDESTGVCFLDDAPAVFFCSVNKIVEYGTHYIYIGDLLDAKTSDSEHPLLGYANGAYHYL